MQPVSVVIPCLNAEKTLARALDSCLMQPDAAQIIVVDDGSQDASPDIAAQYARQHSRVGLLHMPQAGGAARVRNWGAVHATHSLLAFMDADDEYLPGALAAATGFLAAHPRLPSVRLDVEFSGFPVDIVTHPGFAHFAAILSNTLSSSLVIRRCVFAVLGGFPTDAIFIRHGGEDGAFSFALARVFSNVRLGDRKRVRMHYHPGIHAERFFRISMKMQAVPEYVSAIMEASRQFMHRAHAAACELRELEVSGGIA